MSKKCPWCDYSKCPQDVDCDFRSLKFERDAIFARIDQEIEWIIDARKKITGRITEVQKEKLVAGILDRLKGMNIMTTVLKNEFGVSDEKLKPHFKKATMSISERLAFASIVTKMKRRAK